MTSAPPPGDSNAERAECAWCEQLEQAYDTDFPCDKHRAELHIDTVRLRAELAAFKQRAELATKIAEGRTKERDDNLAKASGFLSVARETRVLLKAARLESRGKDSAITEAVALLRELGRCGAFDTKADNSFTRFLAKHGRGAR